MSSIISACERPPGVEPTLADGGVWPDYANPIQTTHQPDTVRLGFWIASSGGLPIPIEDAVGAWAGKEGRGGAAFLSRSMVFLGQLT
jgi:hypothetical protein